MIFPMLPVQMGSAMEAMTRISAGSRLEQLPQHLLVSICEYLAQYQPTTKRSLCAFALASQTCRNATDPERFRRMTIFIRGPQKLQRDMQRWRQTIQTGRRTRFLRVIKIAGETISAEEEKQEEEVGYDPEHMCKRLWPSMVNRVDDEHPELLSGMDYPLCYYPALPSPSTQWPDEQPWQALVELCKELPLLEDVVFASSDQFPRALLSELHENHPQSRLHMRNFGLRSLIHSELEETPAMHADDIALATSPCLYSVVAVTSQCRWEQVVDYNKEAIMEMTAGLAPRLTNVCIVGGTMQSSRIPMSTIPRPPWQGFPSSLVEADQVSSTGEERQGLGSSMLSLESVDQLARQCPQLEELEVQMARGQGDARETAIYHCLGRLPRLKSLTLHLRIQGISPSDMHSGFVLMTFGSHWNMTVPEVQHRYREAAIDAKLALSIFSIIGRINNLRALQLRPYGDYRGPMNGLGRWMCWIARRWVVERDSPGNVMTRELDAQKRKEALKELQAQRNGKEWQTCKKAWDTLWPPRSAQWWDEWSSVPLKSGSEMETILDDIEKRTSSFAAREESRVV
ncbi:hypothetical protein NHJ6243_004812 [Beauveria neobassiana]